MATLRQNGIQEPLIGVLSLSLPLFILTSLLPAAPAGGGAATAVPGPRGTSVSSD